MDIKFVRRSKIPALFKFFHIIPTSIHQIFFFQLVYKELICFRIIDTPFIQTVCFILSSIIERLRTSPTLQITDSSHVLSIQTKKKFYLSIFNLYICRTYFQKIIGVFLQSIFCLFISHILYPYILYILKQKSWRSSFFISIINIFCQPFKSHNKQCTSHL